MHSYFTHQHPPLLNWIKCNTDGAALKCPSLATYGENFRNYERHNPH